jgi:hypothetical protein
MPVDDAQTIQALRLLLEREEMFRHELLEMVKVCDRNLDALNVSLRRCREPPAGE